MNTFRMPAEWEPQSFVQLTWPHKDTDWRPYLDEITAVYVEMARAIVRHERLLVVAPEPEPVAARLRKTLGDEELSRVTFFRCDTNDTWARDHAFISLTGEKEEEIRVLDFRFNGWGEKFEAEKDNTINRRLHESHVIAHLCAGAVYEDHSDLVLEGGSIESDGEGTIFTTTCCLMAPHRNQPLSKTAIENELKRRLWAERIVWLDCEPMAGDDTDGHIDTMVRLAPHHIIIYNEGCRAAAQLKALKTLRGEAYRLVELPLPEMLTNDAGEPMPATYANFLIINGAVLVPTYGQSERDAEAMRLIGGVFEGREVIGIDSRVIVRQHGSVHCCTMQYPSNKKL